MTDEQPGGAKRRMWPIVLALTLVVAIYGYTHYALKHDPSSFEQHVAMCTADYKHARTARDTAEIDALTPPSDVILRSSQTGTCEYFRNEGATK